MKSYYDAQDVMQITGASKSWCYDLIRKLRTMFKKEYPSSITPQAKIPIWYFEKIMKNKEEREENDRNNENDQYN